MRYLRDPWTGRRGSTPGGEIEMSQAFSGLETMEVGKSKTVREDEAAVQDWKKGIYAIEAGR